MEGEGGAGWKGVKGMGLMEPGDQEERGRGWVVRRGGEEEGKYGDGWKEGEGPGREKARSTEPGCMGNNRGDDYERDVD